MSDSAGFSGSNGGSGARDGHFGYYTVLLTSSTKQPVLNAENLCISLTQHREQPWDARGGI